MLAVGRAKVDASEAERKLRPVKPFATPTLRIGCFSGVLLPNGKG